LFKCFDNIISAQKPTGQESTITCRLVKIEPENFSGKTAQAVKKDFCAKLFLITLCPKCVQDEVNQKKKKPYNLIQ
jgi:hypothetical protein